MLGRNGFSLCSILLMVLFSFLTLSLFGQAKYAPKVNIPYHKKGKWGYSDTLGNVLLTPKYDSVGLFDVWQNSHAIFRHKGEYGVLDADFKPVVKNKYKHLKGTNCCAKEEIKFFSVGDGEKWGVYTIDGQEVLPISYDDINYNFLQFGLIAPRIEKKMGLFTLDGIQQSEFIFDLFIPGVFCGGSGSDLCGQAGDEHFIVKQDGTIEPAPEKPFSMPIDIMDKNKVDAKKLSDKYKSWLEGKEEALQGKYGQLQIDYESPLGKTSTKGNYKYVTVEKDGRLGLWETQKDEVEFLNYNDIVFVALFNRRVKEKYGFSELRFVKQGEKYGVVTEQDSVVYDFKYDGFGDITNTYAPVEIDGKYGAIVFFTHYPIIPCKYDDIEYFHTLEVTDGWGFSLYRVKKGKKTGFIGENGVEFFR